MKYHVLANVFSTLFITFIVASCTAMFGENLLAVLSIPLFNLSRIFNAPVIERVDLYVVSLWFLAVGCSLRAYLMAAYYSFRRIFRLRENHIIYTVFVCVFIGISLIRGDSNEAYMLLDILNYIGIGVIFLMMICLILSMFRKNGVVENEQNA